MKPATKVFATLSLSAAVGQKIMTLNESKELFCAGEVLHDIGYEATGKYPYSEITVKMFTLVMKAVGDLLKTPLKPPDLLSILIAGLTDIRAKSNHKDIFDPVIEVAQYCLDLYPDGATDHDKAFERYMRWVA